MDHETLVDIDVNIGSEIVNALDAAKMDLRIALWATFPEYYSPRLVLCRGLIGSVHPLAKDQTFGELLEGKLSSWSFPPLLLMKMSDPFIKDLRDRFATLEDTRGLRLSGRSFGGRYLEDGYVYRIQ